MSLKGVLPANIVLTALGFFAPLAFPRPRVEDTRRLSAFPNIFGLDAIAPNALFIAPNRGDLPGDIAVRL